MRGFSLARLLQPGVNSARSRSVSIHGFKIFSMALNSITVEVMMARQHVREGEERVKRQQALVRKISQQSYPADLAIELLATFEQAQRSNEQHLARLLERQRAQST
jgi:hypothetical protein